MDINFYTILGIGTAATPQEVKLAYKRLAIKYHPDKNPGNTVAEEHFKLINTAYQTLSNPSKRAMYDLKLQYQHERKRVMQQQQAYYNPRYRHTRPPSSVSERYYHTRPVNEKRFSRKDLYITLALVGFIIVFTTALKLVMDYVTGEDKYKTAVVYIQEGKYSSAHSMLNDAIRFQPKRAEAYVARAGLQMNVYENFAAAVQDLNQAMQLQDSVPAKMYYMRGKCYKHLSEFKKAELDQSQALSIDSTYYGAYLERGEVRLFYLNKVDEAISDFTVFLRHAGRGKAWMDALTFRGFGYYRSANYELSQADYRKILAADSTNGRVHYLLGRTLKAQEQQDEACQHLNKAYQLGYTAAALEWNDYCP